MSPNDSVWQGVLLGLGDDGVTYHCQGDTWQPYIPPLNPQDKAAELASFTEQRDEARIELEKYTTDSEDDALYNVRRLRKELTAVTEQRDEARRLAEKYRHLSCDSLEEADETLLPWEITTPNEL
jgi:hypothetical protein